MQIPFHKTYITDDEINEVVDSLKSGWITMGPKTVRFEEAFNQYIGSKHSIAVNSCTAALHLQEGLWGRCFLDCITLYNVLFPGQQAEGGCYMATRLKQEDFIRLPQEPKKTMYRMLLVPEFLLRLPGHDGGRKN